MPEQFSLITFSIDHIIAEKHGDQELIERISSNPEIMTGKPVIKGTRLSVDYILNLLAHGVTFDEILDKYQGLTTQDIQACLLFQQS